ncbi:MAG: Crp/Fnr family transcriptional regulator [Flavipsychrobacter sp.]|nr:Crp/Fnr family transcriptional regulator [Flavipsychrobacter sp.]
MLKTLFSYLSNIHPLTDEVAEKLSSSFEIINVPKRQLLLKDGDVCNYLYVVLSGLARMYYIKDDEEICSLFIEEKYLFHSPHSFYKRKRAYEYIETLEPSVLARIHYDTLQELYKSYPELNFIGRVITENYFVKSEERLYLLRKHTAEERYLYFRERYPTLLQRVPLKYIASYLGLTLETLSRIRNKIRS